MKNGRLGVTGGVSRSRQEYWSGLPFPSPGDLPDPGLEPGSHALQVDYLPFEPPGTVSDEQYYHSFPSSEQWPWKPVSQPCNWKMPDSESLEGQAGRVWAPQKVLPREHCHYLTFLTAWGKAQFRMLLLFDLTQDTCWRKKTLSPGHLSEKKKKISSDCLTSDKWAWLET